jgi:iron complex outermembrane receptor protein
MLSDAALDRLSRAPRGAFLRTRTPGEKLMFRSKALISVGMLIATLPMASVLAAEAEEEGALEEVIVTAQNREENVQRVPIAINVVTAQQLADAGFNDMNDIGKVAPAVQIVNDNSQVRVTMRGVGTNSNDEAQDTSVVVNVDGEYINRPHVMGTSMFDLERVEVLRGPQGTLYGRNSTGGAINFITRKPGDKFAVNASAAYGNYNQVNLEAGVDIPFAEIGGIRVSGIYNDRDGYFSHAATPFAPAAKSGSEKNTAGRVSLRLDPTNALKINLAAERATRDYVNGAYGTVDLNSGGNGPTGPGCNAPGFVQVAPNYPETLCIPKNTNFLDSQDRSSFGQPLFGVGGYTQDSTAVRGRIAYEFSTAATLTYVGGYRDSGGSGHQGLPVVYQAYTFQDDTKTQSHELRLNGDIGRVTYQFGGFYFKEKLAGETGFWVPLAVGPTGPQFDPPPGGSFLSYFGRYVDSESKSVFGQAEIPAGDQFKVVGGLRYTNNKRSAVFKNGSLFGAFPPPYFFFNPELSGKGTGRKDFNTISAGVLNLGSKDTKTTWLIGLNYTPDERTLVYGKVSTGFKGGGFDSVGTFKPETNTAYEVGLKKNFGGGGRNYFNVSAFYYDYRDLQSSVLLDITVGGQTFNAGKATIYGLEAETGFKLTDDDSLSASFNYLHAQYDDFLGQFNVFCVDAGCGINGIGDLDPTAPGIQQPNFKGNAPAFSPKVVISAEYDHTFHLGSAGTLKASLASRYKSSYYTDFFNYHDSQQKAFTSTDVSLEYKPQSGHFGVLAYVRSLEDKRPLMYANFISAGPDDIYNWGYGQPRTYGVRLSVNY